MDLLHFRRKTKLKRFVRNISVFDGVKYGKDLADKMHIELMANVRDIRSEEAGVIGANVKRVNPELLDVFKKQSVELLELYPHSDIDPRITSSRMYYTQPSYDRKCALTLAQMRDCFQYTYYAQKLKQQGNNPSVDPS